MSKERRSQQAPAPSGVSGSVDHAGAQDFGSNAAMAEELAGASRQAMPVRVVQTSEVSTGPYAMDREWEAIIDRGAKHGLTEGDKVTDGHATGRVAEAFTFRAQVRWYDAFAPNNALTVHLGTPWSRDQAMAKKTAQQADRAAEEREADRESEYRTRRTPGAR